MIDFTDASAVFRLVSVIWILLSVPTFLYLLKHPAPYGRYATKGWGAMIPDKLGWMVMELPVLLIVITHIVTNSFELTLPGRVAIAFFISHYIYRCLVYPLRIRTTGKQMPLTIAIAAIVFNLINGNLIGLGLTRFAEHGLGQFNVLAVTGVVLFITGLLMHIAADNHLVALRKLSGNGYEIPYGKIFSKISCPNYLGEIIEWVGFAMITNHIAAWSFAIWTAANLIPRALHHHRWYLTHFKDYPPERKALVPYLL